MDIHRLFSAANTADDIDNGMSVNFMKLNIVVTQATDIRLTTARSLQQQHITSIQHTLY